MNELKDERALKSEVSLVGMPGNADASPTLNLIFVTLCFCFWANSMGFLGEGATLAIGVLQIAVFTGYMVGGIILISRGNAFGGNTFLIFATFFGGAGGFTHVAMTIAGEFGVAFDYQVLGIAFILCGLFLLATLPGLATAPKTDFLCFLFGGLGVLGYGLTGAEILPISWNIAAGWCLFIDGVIAFWAFLATMLGFCGIKLSCGKPFVTPKA